MGLAHIPRPARLVCRAITAVTVLAALALVGAHSAAYGATSYGGFPASFWGSTASIPSASGAIE